MKNNLVYWFRLVLLQLLFVSCSGDSAAESEGTITPDPTPDGEDYTKPDPDDKLLYNGIELPSQWVPFSNYSTNIYAGMSPTYLEDKPDVINITVGRQLFVDDFLIESTDLERKWYSATYYSGNPVLSPQTEWELGSSGGGWAAPFSDGVWYDESDQLFKMWYMGSGGSIGDSVTCYAESTDGINWTRPSLNVVSGTNIVNVPTSRDSYSVWIDKTAEDSSERYKMFGVSDGAGAWKYHYYTSSDGKAWRERSSSSQAGVLADRSTVFYNPFRDVWVYSMRHNVRIDENTLIRARDYFEYQDPSRGTELAEADLDLFWFGPWPDEPRHTNSKYAYEQPAIYNLDAIAYESLLIGTFSVWTGPENDVCAADGVIKENQLMLGYSRNGWHWSRDYFTPFCAVSDSEDDWNYGNIQSACGSPIIVGDKLYFYMSGRRFEKSSGKEIVSTGLATLRRDGFASISGTGTLTTETLKFTGEYLYINADINGSIQVEIYDTNGDVIDGYSKDECQSITTDGTKLRVTWNENKTLSDLSGENIKLKFYLTDSDLYAFWISQTEDGKSYGFTGGGAVGANELGIDM